MIRRKKVQSKRHKSLKPKMLTAEGWMRQIEDKHGLRPNLFAEKKSVAG